LTLSRAVRRLFSLCACLCASLSSAAFAADAYPTIIGAGGNSCGTWTAAEKYTPRRHHGGGGEPFHVIEDRSGTATRQRDLISAARATLMHSFCLSAARILEIPMRDLQST
jgi:hypothetical protein